MSSAQSGASSDERHRVIVGTAGHIDHGKTSLVEALTGIDCDRWVEEKDRGITIDLGFAHLVDDVGPEGRLQIGFVDVPGHERFVHNALAGLGGIDLMMLVVAADEGIMPQTREHLDICRLLGIRGGLVALTKIDLVDDDMRELAELELTEALEPTAFGGCPILPVSSTTGEGLEGLRAVLLEHAHALESRSEVLELPARLPIDRAFHLRGLGVLVTGTLAAGALELRGEPELSPGHKKVRIRSIQVHGEDRGGALAGERTALQLSGATLDDVPRGTQMIAEGGYTTTVSLLARMTLLDSAPDSFRGFREVRFHLYASEVLGRLRPLEPDTLEPGGTALVEIRLRAPVTAARGDRFVVRRPSPQTTMGGGTILDPAWPRHRGKRLAEAVVGLGGDRDTAVDFWVATANEAGLTAADLAARLGEPRELALASLREHHRAGRLLQLPGRGGSGDRYIAVDVVAALEKKAKKVLDDYFRRERLARGMPKAEAVRTLLPPAAVPWAETYLTWLTERSILVVEGDTVNLPGRDEQLTEEESSLAKRILAEFEAAGLTPPSPKEIRARVGSKPQIFDGVLRYLHQRKKLARLPQGLFLATSSLESLERDLAAAGWADFSVGDFKDHFSLTRKWAIPLLEYLDQKGVTRREGDRRKLITSR
ncbi:MAG: selenocysteine-specific translation elongation factor [Acidobacteriota bacterium]|nr:selenocysteine-specific translation elongation factor [Acidobacteriota bacterium]